MINFTTVAKPAKFSSSNVMESLAGGTRKPHRIEQTIVSAGEARESYYPLHVNVTPSWKTLLGLIA